MAKQLLCISEAHNSENNNEEGFFVQDGVTYPVLTDNHGQFIEDSNGDEHYLSDLNERKNAFVEID